MTSKEIHVEAARIANFLRALYGNKALRGNPEATEARMSEALDFAQREWEDNHPSEFERKFVADLVRAVLVWE